MSAPTFEQRAPVYRRLWDSMVVRPEKEAQVLAMAQKLQANRDRYLAVAEPLGMPWQLVAALHSLEASGSFTKHLHNGDPLSARTVRVPAGRPATGKPPFTWEESARDALAMKRPEEWRGQWTVERALWFAERYNGWGYVRRPIYSPYLWATTTHYIQGKYVKDGVYSPSAVSAQVGVAPLLRALLFPPFKGDL